MCRMPHISEGAALLPVLHATLLMGARLLSILARQFETLFLLSQACLTTYACGLISKGGAWATPVVAGSLACVGVLSDALLLPPWAALSFHGSQIVVWLGYALILRSSLRLCGVNYNATLNVIQGRNISAMEFLVGRIVTLGVFFVKYTIRSWYRPGAFVTLMKPLLRSEEERLDMGTIRATADIGRGRSGRLGRWATLTAFAEVLAGDDDDYGHGDRGHADDGHTTTGEAAVGGGAVGGKPPAGVMMVPWEPAVAGPSEFSLTRRRPNSTPPDFAPSPPP
jgi:hypothetical protein